MSHYIELCLFYLRQLALEDNRENLLFIGFQDIFRLVFLHYQIVNDITVYTGETHFLELLLQHAYHGNIKLAAHQQHIISLILGSLDIAVLLIFVVGIQINQIAILIRLAILYQGLILFEGIILVVRIGKKGEILCSIIEILLCEHSVVDEDFQIVPLLFKLLTVVLEYGLQAVGYFFRNICRDFLHIGVTLQIGTGYVQRNIRRIEYTVQQCQKVRNNTLYRVRYIDLIAIKLDFVLVQFYIALYLREVQNTSKMERIIHIQMYPEQGFIGHRIEVAIELLVILVF